MRRGAQRNSWLVVFLLLPAFMAGAVGGDKQEEADDGIDVYFRDVDLAALSDQAMEKYPETEAGESVTFDRAFPDAPPQISHSVEDMLPITWDNNECLECHHPDNAASEEDAPIPATHFERPVMAKGGKADSMVWVVKRYEKAKDVAGSRYTCDMCHTPQAENVDTPATSFVSVKP